MSYTPSFNPNYTRTSALAVWSLFCGILGIPCCCIPLLPSVMAVLLGHFALSAIRDSAGTLTGRGKAIAGLVLGYGGLGFAVLILLDSTHNGDVMGTGKAIRAENEVVNAVAAYITEYGDLPESLRFKEDLTLSADNNRLLDILRARSAVDNPRGIVFYHGPLSPENPPRGGLGTDGVLYDPWGKPYFITLDSNGNGKVEIPDKEAKGWSGSGPRVTVRAGPPPGGDSAGGSMTVNDTHISYRIWPFPFRTPTPAQKSPP